MCATFILFAAYSVYACIFQGFFHRFFIPFSRSSPSIFRPINTSDTFPRWHHHSVYSLFSYLTHSCAFFLESFARKFFPQIVLIHSLDGATITYDAYTVFWTNFCALRYVTFFKNVPTQNPVFYTRVPLELSQLVVTLDCISTRKLNLFCLSNIVFYHL